MCSETFGNGQGVAFASMSGVHSKAVVNQGCSPLLLVSRRRLTSCRPPHRARLIVDTTNRLTSNMGMKRVLAALLLLTLAAPAWGQKGYQAHERGDCATVL